MIINYVCSKVAMVKEGKLKCHDGSNINAIARKTSIKALLLDLDDKPYPFLGLCIPQAILEETLYFTFTLTIINVTFYYSIGFASVLKLEQKASSLHNS